MPVLSLPDRGRWDYAGENEAGARREGGKKVCSEPGCRQSPGVDVVDHDDCDALEAPKHCCKLCECSSLVTQGQAKRRHDCHRGWFYCASTNVKSVDALILEARVQR
jgi:hypothetical protein